MPWPRSIISLSIASVRPSIRATPSAISRMTPTFCLTVVALAPAISTSISVKRSAICYSPSNNCLDSKASFESGQSGPDAGVINVTAHFDAHASNQRRVLRERDAQLRAVHSHKIRSHVRLQISGQGRGAFDFRYAPGTIELHQAPKIREKSDPTTTLGF